MRRTFLNFLTIFYIKPKRQNKRQEFLLNQVMFWYLHFWHKPCSENFLKISLNPTIPTSKRNLLLLSQRYLKKAPVKMDQDWSFLCFSPTFSILKIFWCGIGFLKIGLSYLKIGIGFLKSGIGFLKSGIGFLKAGEGFLKSGICFLKAV